MYYKKKINLFLILFFFFPFFFKSQDDLNEKINEDSTVIKTKYNYFHNTFIFFNEYLDTPNGSFNTTQARVNFPVFNKAWDMRFDLPLVSGESSTKNKTGLGDISAALTYLPFFVKDKHAIFVRVKVSSNSASDKNFGYGKWIITPGILYQKTFGGRNQFFWISSIEYKRSIFGQKNKNKVETFSFENLIQYSFSKYWLSANYNLYRNIFSKRFENKVFTEFGVNLSKFSLYVHPSIGLGRHRSYNHGLEFGILVPL